MNFYHSKVSKICILIGPFRARYITFGLKKYREVIFHGNEELRKIWTKTDLWLGKWQEEFGKFSSEHLKVSKLVLSWDTFVQSTKYMCNDIEEWWKIWSGIDLLFQNWHKEFDEFWLGHLKVSKIYTLMGYFWPKCITFELKKNRGVIYHDTREWCKIWKKTDWYEEFGKLSPEHTIISKLGLFLGPFSQSRNVWA